VQFALSVGPEEAVRTGFEWTTDAEQVSSLVESYKSELGRKWQGRAPEISASAEDTKESFPDFQVMPGARKCVQSLLDNEMQCAVVSYLDRDQVEILLEQAGLDDLITPDKRVSASNGYVTDNDQLLGAALRVERRPDHCVVFDTTPYASAAAHDVKMQSVSFIGPFPRYDLLSADSTTSSFEEMTAMNIRRLFGERIYDQPQTENIQAQPGTDRKTKTKYFFDDER
jgi:beta-phosphoglucomutase-like phosphatase (HAD superfamily)